MDLYGLWPILVIILLFLPQLLKSRQPQKYEYPEIPPKTNPPPPVQAKPSKAVGGKPPGASQQPASASQKESQASTVVSESQPWQGNLDQAVIVNGIIFSEILQPPRALRPLKQRSRRR